MRWFVMRLTAQGSYACACERNWSTYEWGNSKKRNQLGTGRAEKRSFSIIRLLSKCGAISNGFVLWDLAMIIDEPDDAGWRDGSRASAV
jgi:alpha-tubulin suppressor-like RCC1 family protein